MLTLCQRAFRQRKETYIRKLEEEVKGLDSIREQLKQLITENYSLREYVISLQGRLMEVQGDCPEVPPGIDLHNPRHDLAFAAAGLTGGPAGSSQPAPAAQNPQHTGTGNEDMNSLNRIAVAGLGMRKHPDEANFMGNNFQTNKRGRSDENQGDGADVNKHETHGLPIA